MIFLMFLICTFIGFFLGENYKRRSIHLKEFQKALLVYMKVLKMLIQNQGKR